jgi:hypothetical protein
MKKILIGLALLSAIVFCHAQTLTITNGDKVETVSNGFVVATAPLTLPAPPLVTNDGKVVPQAFVDALAQATGIPSEVLKLIPLKYLFWLFVISVGLPVVSRYARKLVPDNLQTGKLGAALAHCALEINPQLTPTPPNVPKPSVVLQDVQTGAKVEPEAVKPTIVEPPKPIP